MLRLSSEITIQRKGATTKFVFDYVNSVTIDSSWETFTDTASIFMPNTLRNKNGNTITAGTKGLFKRGDAVTIKLGYFPKLVTRFEGFIDRIRPTRPMEIMCEDQMWQLKQVNLATELFTNPTIKTVVDKATASQAGLKIVYDDETAKIGDFHIDNKGFVNAVSIFEVLKKQFGYNIYFQDGTLFVRVINAIKSLVSTTHIFDFQFNVVSDSLEFTRDDDTTLAIRFESKQPDNSVLTFFGFKENGENVIKSLADVATKVKTFGVTHKWNVPDRNEAEIKKIINDNLDKYVWEGLKGAFTGFLDPPVNHDDKVQLIDKGNPDHEGTYIIKSIQTTFGVNGGRQTITPRNKV